MRKRMLLPVVIVVAAVVIFVFLEERFGLLSPGDTAPEARFTRVSGEQVALREFLRQGPVILIFYPKDFTTGCTQQVCAFRDSYQRFTRVGATIIAVSRDGATSHERFSRTYNLPFELVTDADGSASRAFGVERLWGAVPLVKRVTYVISKDGEILRTIHHELFMGRHVDDAIDVLERQAGVKGES
jgi:thioredoxin-dependent peroxiredoxin